MEQQKYPISGVESVQGKRVSMEDTHVSIDNVKERFPEAPECSFYGVYDGHGGRDAAVKCEELLHKNIINDPSFSSGNIEEAIKIGFANTDKEILDFSEKEGWKSGSTVVVTIICDGTLYIANTGDSEAVLAQREGEKLEAKLLSHKHKPGDAEEKERIKAAGGHVVFGRVMGSLAVARALGDRDFKYPFNKGSADFVSAEPFIHSIPLPSGVDFLLVSCDGLWDKLSYEEAVNLVGEERYSGKNPTEAAQAVVKKALDNGTLDNVTCIVVYFPETIKISKPNSDSNETKKTVSETPTETSNKTSNKEEKKSHEENDDGEGRKLMDAYEFLRMDFEDAENLMKAIDKLRYFDLDDSEELISDYSCSLGQKILYQGTLLLTERHLCFYSTMLKKKIKRQVCYKDIAHVEKTRGMFVANSLRVTTRDGKKLVFNWKQGSSPRDVAFSKLIELTGINPDEKLTQIDSEEEKSDKKLNGKKDSEDEDEDEENEEEKEKKEEKEKNKEKKEKKEKKGKKEKEKGNEGEKDKESEEKEKDVEKEKKKEKKEKEENSNETNNLKKSQKKHKKKSHKKEEEQAQMEDLALEKENSESEEKSDEEKIENWSRF